MKTLLRKVKAALGIGSIWGVAFGGVGALLGAILPATSFLSIGVLLGAGGLVLGMGFAGLLSVMEGRRTLGELTTRRAALWGFVAGTALALVGSVVIGGMMDVVSVAEGLLGLSIPIGLQITALVGGAASYGAIAAGLASATVAMAKRSPSELPSDSSASEHELLGGGEA